MRRRCRRSLVGGGHRPRPSIWIVAKAVVLMKAKLVVVGGDAKAAEISLKLPTIIGRGRGSKLVLPHPLVSRRHCEIFESDGQLMVRDLGSLNGTFVGDERVDERAETVLPPGELLTIGAVTFRAVYGELDEEAGSGDGKMGIPSELAPGAATVRGKSPGTAEVRHSGREAAAIDTQKADIDESIANDDVDFAEFDAEVDDEEPLDDDSTELVEMDSDIEVSSSDETVRPPNPPRRPPPIAPGRTAHDPPATDADDQSLNSFLDGLK